MKSTITSLLFLVSISFLASCSEDPAASTKTIQQLFPMSPGNVWKLQVVNYDDLGNIVNIYTGDFLIDSVGMSFGHTGFHVTLGEPGFLYYTENELRVQDPDHERDNQLIVRYPMNVGEEIVTRDTTYSDGYRSRSVITLVSENTPISVPAGTFNCMIYRDYSFYGKGTLDTTSYSQFAFCFGIGYIQQADYDYDDSTHKPYPDNINSLISYTVK